MLPRFGRPSLVGFTSSTYSAAFSTKPEQRTPPSQPAASTSAAPVPPWQDGKPRVPRSTPGTPSPRRVPLHKRPPSTFDPPSDPLAVLNRIRSASPPSVSAPNSIHSSQPLPPSPGNTAAINAHNVAVNKILAATSKSPQAGNVRQAFVEGWQPIRATRQAGRLEPDTLAKVLQIAGEALLTPSAIVSAGGSPPPVTQPLEWADVRELAVFLAQERDMPGVAAFCWRQLSSPHGARLVIELVATLSEDAVALRAQTDAPDALSRRQAFEATAPPRLPVSVFAAYIAAHAVVHYFDPATSPSSGDLFPSFFVPPPGQSFPNLRNVNSFPHLVEKHHPSLSPEVKAFVVTWLRQASLFQEWVEKPNGVAVIGRVTKAFRRGNFVEPWVAWTALQEAIDGEAAWLSTDQWDASGKWRRFEQFEEDLPVQPEVAVEPSDNAPHDRVGVARSPEDAVPPSRATLTQSHVAHFLKGFIFADRFDQASAIWAWLVSRSPPLTPGVVAWTGLLAAYARKGDVRALELAWDQMTSAGVAPDIWAWTELATAHFESKDVAGGMHVVETMFSAPDLASAWANPDVASVIYNRLILCLLNASDLQRAHALVVRMEERGTPLQLHTVNLFLQHHTRPVRPDLAGIMDTLKLLGDRGLEPDVFTFTIVLQSLLKSGAKDATVRLMKLMENSSVRPSMVTYGAIISHLAATGKIVELTAAVQLLDELERRGLPTTEIIYTSILQGFLKAVVNTPVARPDSSTPHPYFAAALQLKDRMAQRGIPLNRVGYNSIISAALGLRTSWGIQLALTSFRDLESATRERAGDQDSGRVVGRAESWYVLINGFARMGDWSTARELVREMEAGGFEARPRHLVRLVDSVRRGGFP